MNQDSTPRRTAPQTNRANPPQAHRKYVRTQPARRIQPIHITQWKYLWRQEFIELRRGGRATAAGWVDELTLDGTIIWICLAGGMGRVIIHHSDGSTSGAWTPASFRTVDRSRRQKLTKRRDPEIPTSGPHPLPGPNHRCVRRAAEKPLSPQLLTDDRSLGYAMSKNTSSQETQLPGEQKPDSAEPTGQDLDYEDLACCPWIGLHYRTAEKSEG